ncbi:PaaI family thioesterase [Nocardioides sp. P5_E3]
MSTDVRQRTYDWDDPAPTALAGLDRDGLAVMRGIGAGELPLPPAVRTLGIEPRGADPGRVDFRLELGEYHLNPFGIVHGGVLAAMMDTAMGCAVHSLLPAAVGYVTGELNVRFLRPALLSGGPLLCTGDVVHAGRTTMVASARVVDAGERVIALAGATCMVRRS